MKNLFDFGLSQEDPLTEQAVLDIHDGDHILSVASGGEVPLGLISLNSNIHITAIDSSLSQIMLCRLKWITALYVDFPLNARFLGYSPLKESERITVFEKYIRPFLSDAEENFWQRNINYILKGAVNTGRFEKYIRKMRLAGHIIIGRKNLEALIRCNSLVEQESLFSKKIASRKILQLLFRVAFHPRIYKNRGLSEQALIHAGEDTGQRFFRRFSEFCTGTPASSNYFLQYFLLGKCITEDSYPDYLQPRNKNRLQKNRDNIEFRHISFREVMKDKNTSSFNKIHFSNLGDWMNPEEFFHSIELIKSTCRPGTRICYRYLQKDHLTGGVGKDKTIEKSMVNTGTDRFPFYTTYLIRI
ncbi:MAG TPA: DUF3419 family protein [Bacteroidales bacterium]|nr:DUF3419 family protein [Bacteroidales bacterium]